MTKHILKILFVVLSLSANAQTFTKADFSRTDWFSENKDSLFFVSDTIRLIKHSNKGPEWVKWVKDVYAEFELEYFGHGDYLNFGFKKFGRLEYWECYNNISCVPLATFSWKFDKKNTTIKVFRESRLFFELKPISKRKIKIKSRFAQHRDLLSTEELTLIKIK